LRLGRTIVAVFLILALPACKHDRKAATPPSLAVRTAIQAGRGALVSGDLQPRHQIDAGFRVNRQTPEKPIDVVPISGPMMAAEENQKSFTKLTNRVGAQRP
jgi:hypothetical protein